MKTITQIILLVLISTNLLGQTKNAYKFIEPNISISYDSNLFKITNRYSNTTYGTENYDFELKDSSKNKVRILVKADIPSGDNLTMQGLEKFMTGKIAEIKKIENDEIKIVSFDNKVQHTKDFLCLGAVNFVKPLNAYMTTIICNRISENDLTEISFTFQNAQSLDSCYKLVSDFLSGFKHYTKKQFEDEETNIKSKYTISFDILPFKDTINYFTGRKISRLIELKINQKLSNTFKEVLFNDGTGFGYLVIDNPENSNNVLLESYARDKGKVNCKGDVIILNSFGKKVKIPFSFSFQNE